MSTGKLIKDAPLGRVIGNMKIPVTGNFAITPDQLRGFINSSSSIYETTDPTILPSNGLVQDLKLGASGKLTFDSLDGQEVFLRVSGNYPLDLSEFYNVRHYTRDPTKRTFILIINWLGTPLMFAYDYENGDDEPVDPIHCEGAGSSAIHTFIKRPDTNVEDFKMTIRVDGVDVDPVTPPTFLKVSDYTGNVQIPDGYVGAFKSSLLTENTDSKPHKIEFILNDEVVSVLVTGNKSVVDLGSTPYTHYGFCLNPSSVPMGCEGATQDFSLSHIEGVYDFYINGTLMITLPIGLISGWLNSNGYANRLVIDFDGTMNAQNMTQDEYFLLDFVGVNGEQPWSFTDPSNNPSFVEHPNLGFTVCLAPKGELSCEGATISIAVQLTLPENTVTTFTVNGTVATFIPSEHVGQSLAIWFNNIFGKDVLMSRSDFTIFDSVNGKCNSVIIDNTNFALEAPYQVDNGAGLNKTFSVTDGQYAKFMLGGDEITCEGATSDAQLGDIHEESGIIVKVNGVVVEKDYQPSDQWAPTYGQQIILQKLPDGSYSAMNTTTKELRVTIQTNSSLNSGDIGWSLNNNPTLDVDYLNKTIKFCLSVAEPKYYGIWQGTTENPNDKSVLRLLLFQGAVDAIVTDPNGNDTPMHFTVANPDQTFPRILGYYKISAKFANTLTDIIYLCSDDTIAPASPVLQSVTRMGETARFVGTAPPNSVIGVYGDYDPQSFDIPFAFAICSPSGAFDFVVPFPRFLTNGYLRAHLGTFGSVGTTFTIT